MAYTPFPGFLEAMVHTFDFFLALRLSGVIRANPFA